MRSTAGMQERLIAWARILDSRRVARRILGVHFNAAEVRADATRFQSVSSDLVSLDVTENGKLFYADAERVGAEYEGYTVEHTFTFTREPSGWVMSSTTPHVQPGTSSSTDVIATSRLIDPAEAVALLASTPVGGKADSKVLLAPNGQPLNVVTSTKPPRYNYAAMVNYARKYWKYYNPNYRAYSNDCTNFVSQIMKAGGWADELGAFGDENSKWYYGTFTFTTPHPWAGAHNFGVFANEKSWRTQLKHHPKELVVSDVLQVDWDFNEEAGNIDHTFFVTGRVGSGVYADDLLLTYHSNDRLNRSYNEMLLQDEKAGQPQNRWVPHRT